MQVYLSTWQSCFSFNYNNMILIIQQFHLPIRQTKSYISYTPPKPPLVGLSKSTAAVPTSVWLTVARNRQLPKPRVINTINKYPNQPWQPGQMKSVSIVNNATRHAMNTHLNGERMNYAPVIQSFVVGQTNSFRWMICDRYLRSNSVVAIASYQSEISLVWSSTSSSSYDQIIDYIV